MRHYDVSFECPSVEREKLRLTLFQVVETKFIPNIDVIKGQKQMLLKVVKTMCVKYSGKIMKRKFDKNHKRDSEKFFNNDNFSSGFNWSGRKRRSSVGKMDIPLV